MSETVLKRPGRQEDPSCHIAAFESQSWLNFVRSLNSKATLKGYTHDVMKYMEFLKVENPDELLKGTQELLENQVLGYIEHRKKEGASSYSIRRACSSIKKFYDRNRKILSWPFVLGSIGKTKKRQKDKAYTREQIEKLLDNADLREKSIILLYSSSGIRKGSIPLLTIGDLTPIDKYGLYKITVYQGYTEEYFTFCTPESRKALDAYFDYRKRSGETLTDKSPVIREMFDKTDADKVKRPIPIAESTIYGIIHDLAEKAGLRKRIKIKKGQKLGSVRHDSKLLHGFRKWFDTQTSNAGMNLLWVEMLQGHDIKLKDSYYRPTDQQLLEGTDDMKGYIGIINALTINEEHRLKRQVKELEKEKSDWAKHAQALEDRIAKLERQGKL